MNIDLTKLNRIEIINESGRVLTVRQDHLGFTVQDDGRTLKVFMKSEEHPCKDAGSCNPCEAKCGARFCTYEEMAAHSRECGESKQSHELIVLSDAVVDAFLETQTQPTVDHYHVVRQPILDLEPSRMWEWCVSDGQIITVRCGSEALAQRICAMMNRAHRAAAIPK